TLTTVPVLCAAFYPSTALFRSSCTATTTGTITEPSAVTAGSTHTPILCNGGSSTVTVTAGGGTPPYTGAGDHVVSAGSYSFTVSEEDHRTAMKTRTNTGPSPVT